MNDVVSRLDAIDPDECLALLERHHIGRIGVVVDGQPLVLPVNYAMSGSDVVFRSDEGTKLHGALGGRVAFEIDGHDNVYHEGWSVLVVGRAEAVSDRARLRQYEQLPLVPWTGPKARWVRIHADAVTGRRIVRVARPEGEETS
jgi:nitroimidazol reductase NimA-like FMN-containing flavoprotein (pyridoxamine 5'-phosphate oxidase superfamily)